MITLRPAGARGHARFDGIDSRHSFSFGSYYDPDHMGFGPLRVINDDRVGPGTGFPPHPHRDMEILTVVLDGALAHRDSMGNGSVIHAGDVQYMSAGTGIRHSEFNASDIHPVRFLQIWIEPDAGGYAPRYDQTYLAPDDITGKLALVAGPEGSGAELAIRRDAALYAARLMPGDSVEHHLAAGRSAWVQVAKGKLTLNGESLSEGDGAAIRELDRLTLAGVEEAELLLFDIA